MTRDDDFTRRLEDYLHEHDGTTPLPERVRDAIHAALPRTRQAPARRGPLGVLTMVSRSSTARWGVAVAAVVAAVVLGAAIFSGGNDLGVGGPAPTQAPVATPAPSSSAAAGPVSLSSAPGAPCYPEATTRNCIAAGTYAVRELLPVVISLDVPAGWFSWRPGPGTQGVLVDSGPDAPSGSGWGLLLSSVGSVSRDPCDRAAGDFGPEEVDTPEELVAAIAAWPGFEVSEPEAVTLDTARGLRATVAYGGTTAECADPVAWTSASGTAVDAYPMVGAPETRHSATFRILDVDGRLLLLRTTDFGDPSPFELSQGVAPDPSRHEADLVELQAIIDSIRLEPRPAQQ